MEKQGGWEVVGRGGGGEKEQAVTIHTVIGGGGTFNSLFTFLPGQVLFESLKVWHIISEEEVVTTRVPSIVVKIHHTKVTRRATQLVTGPEKLQ